MSNRIPRGEGPGTSVVLAAEPNAFVSFLDRAVKDPALDVAKLEALLRLQREIVADDARMQFNRAMAAAQAKMRPVLRNARNEQTSSRYATLEAIDAAIRPIYQRAGFCLEFSSEPPLGTRAQGHVDGPNVRIVCEVSHSAGHSKHYALEAAIDTVGPKGTGNKTPVQGLGSSVSYLRRYLTMMIFNLILTNEDNDGNRTIRTDAARDGRISLDQLAVLSDLMRQTGTAEIRFLAAMAPGLTSIEDARAADFPRLKNALLTKQGVLRQRARLTHANGAAKP